MCTANQCNNCVNCVNQETGAFYYIATAISYVFAALAVVASPYILFESVKATNLDLVDTVVLSVLAIELYDLVLEQAIVAVAPDSLRNRVIEAAQRRNAYIANSIVRLRNYLNTKI